MGFSCQYAYLSISRWAACVRTFCRHHAEATTQRDGFSSRWTTILAGSYHDFSSSRPVLGALLGVLPQKSFLNLVEGANILKTLPQLVYLLAGPVLLIALSAFLTDRKLRTGA
jgi:hypothetical protein